MSPIFFAAFVSFWLSQLSFSVTPRGRLTALSLAGFIEGAYPRDAAAWEGVAH